MSIVAHVRTKGDVISDTKKVMNLVNWSEHIDGDNVFIKVNYMSDQVIPGLCTSPWLLEGVLQELTSQGKRVTIGDADLATSKQLVRAINRWGVVDICKKYNIKFVNLSNEPTTNKSTQIPDVIESIPIPNIILNADNVITLPVAKTHYLTRLTCSLKNQWGTIPRFRQQYHPIADLLIPEINRILNVNLTIIDATICMEGEGPRTGIPKLVNSILASPDLVAADRCVQDIMGLSGEIKHIENSAKMIKGSQLAYQVLGDPLETFKFIEAKKTIVTNFELLLRHVPILNTIIFKTGFFAIPSMIATKYNTFYYFKRYGIKYREKVLEQAPQYKALYGILPGYQEH
ncbi:MAG: DUF362 domain-containing protein [Candidatus Thorarchaeota archaeon]|nr:DUF362 domain-containing protein [Candidatus Thorarchaeota archaeon]